MDIVDVPSENEVKFELSFIEILDVENNKINFIILNVYLPPNNNKRFYNNIYKINIKNKKK